MRSIYEVTHADIDILLSKLNTILAAFPSKTPLPNPQNPPPMDFYLILNYVDVLIATTDDEAIKKQLMALLVDEIAGINELNGHLTNESAMKHLKELTKPNPDFLNLEHQYICDLWKVNGPIHDYPKWLDFLKGANECLEDNYYGNLVIRMVYHFGFHKDSMIVNVADTIYDHDVTETPKPYVKRKLTNEELRKEVNIWTLENVLTVLFHHVLAFVKINDNDFAIKHKIHKVKESLLFPIVEQIINPLRRQYNHRQALENSKNPRITFYHEAEINQAFESKFRNIKEKAEKMTPLTLLIPEKEAKKEIVDHWRKINEIKNLIMAHNFNDHLHHGGEEVDGKMMSKGAANIIRLINTEFDNKVISDEELQHFYQAVKRELVSKLTDKPQRWYSCFNFFNLGARDNTTIELYQQILQSCEATSSARKVSFSPSVKG